MVLHAYRSGYGQAANDPPYESIKARLAQRPPIYVSVPVGMAASTSHAVRTSIGLPWSSSTSFLIGNRDHAVLVVGFASAFRRSERVGLSNGLTAGRAQGAAA